MNNYIVVIVLLFTIGSCAAQPIPSAPVAVTDQSSEYYTIPEIPTELNLAGEEVPMHYFDVYEGFVRELVSNSYLHSSTLQILQRAGRYQEAIEKILTEQQVPLDFFYLAVIESGLRNVVSPAGATGFWQFMKSASKEYKLEISEEVDMRYDWETSTYAACKLLKDAYARYKSWTLAAAAYNAGMNGVTRRLTEQKVNSYYDLLLPEETTRYVFRILALKTIMQNPQKYGFEVTEEQAFKPIPYTTVEVTSSIPSLADFALEHNTNLKLLRMMNPWLRSTKLTVAPGKTYTLKIPIRSF